MIWGSFYTTAGAIDVLGPKYKLPHAVSGHLNYYFWDPGDKPWDMVIAVTPDERANFYPMKYCYWDIETKANATNMFSMNFNRYYIYVCKQRMNGQSKEAIWNRLKYFW